MRRWIYFLTSATTNATMVLQVKSGIVDRADIAQLRGDMQREGAAMATLITLANPTSKMIAEAKTDGRYRHELMDRDYDKIQIVTVREIIEEGRRLDIPLVKEATKPTIRGKKRAADPVLPGLDDSPETEITDMVEHLKSGAADQRSAPKDAPASKGLPKKRDASDR